MPYSEPEDMLLGQFTLPSNMPAQKFVQDAADEIDMKIGFVYATPVVAADGETLPRPVSLLLKRINVYISTARAIMAAAGPSGGDEVNAYARSLLADAHAALDAVSDGRTVLEGAERLPDQGEEKRGPRISNIDSVSQVDAFYGYFGGGSHDLFQPSSWYGLRGVNPQNHG
jgi:hypothetical protein